MWERSDAEARELEGLKPRVGLLRGKPLSGTPVVHEHGLAFKAEIDAGHKTGFYLDQRDNRRLLRELASGKDVLDCFSYTGGFALNALHGGAKSVVAIDSSGLALDMARTNRSLNDLAGAEWIEGDVFQTLRKFRDQARTFDVIVLDPPKFAPTAAHAERASRAYKDINLLAFKMLRPGGHLMTFSCSGGVSADLFQKIVAGAALDARVDARIEKWLHAAPDHPVALSFPESEYLKGLFCRVLGISPSRRGPRNPLRADGEWRERSPRHPGLRNHIAPGTQTCRARLRARGSHARLAGRSVDAMPERQWRSR